MPRLSRQYRDLSLPVTEFVFTVHLPEEGTRLDLALRSHFPWRSREHFQGMVERLEVTVNGGGRKASTRLRKGDVVRVKIPVHPDAPEKESGEGLVILYEDEALVAIDKASGVVAHPTGRIRHGTLINRLHARYRNTGAPSADVVPRLAHRLDRDTSGVLLVVKDRKADATVTRSFFRREVKKTYFALVRGAPASDAGLIDLPIGPHPQGETTLHMAVREDGQAARTRWSVVERLPGHAWMRLEPQTGRTHQLRVHMAAIGFPIVADHLYGDVRPLRRSTIVPDLSEADDAVLLDRLALHAHRLEIAHPVTSVPLAIESPIPADLTHALQELRRLVESLSENCPSRARRDRSEAGRRSAKCPQAGSYPVEGASREQARRSERIAGRSREGFRTGSDPARGHAAAFA